MNKKIISLAISLPQAYPWVKENLSVNNEELNSILQENGLRNEEDRRFAGWIIKFNILRESKLSTSPEKVVEKVLSILSDKKYIDADIIMGNQRRLFLYNPKNLGLYHKLLNNDITGKEVEEDIEKYISWLVEISTHYFGVKVSACPAQIQKETEHILHDKLNIDKNCEKFIKDAQYRKGFNRVNICNLFNKRMDIYKDEINESFSKILGISVENEVVKEDVKKEVTKEGISDSILDLFNDMPEFNEQVESKKQVTKEVNKSVIKKDLVEKEVKHKKSNIIQEKVEKPRKDEEIFKNLESLSSVLGYKLARKDDVVITLDKYNKLLDFEKEKEIKIMKELALFRNGAVLSELYNSYKNIDNISKENLEATMANFFTTLSINGFEVVENGNRVDDEIEVNTSNLLKDFIFSKAIDKDGQVTGTIEYLGWSYKGKQIVPMVIKPNK